MYAHLRAQPALGETPGHPQQMCTTGCLDPVQIVGVVVAGRSVVTVGIRLAGPATTLPRLLAYALRAKRSYMQDVVHMCGQFPSGSLPTVYLYLCRITLST